MRVIACTEQHSLAADRSVYSTAKPSGKWANIVVCARICALDGVKGNRTQVTQLSIQKST